MLKLRYKEIMDTPIIKKIKIMCGCCTSPLNVFVAAVTELECTYGVIPCSCKGVPPTQPEKAKVIFLDYARAKKAEARASKRKK